MHLRTLQDIDIVGKTVLVRVDFNVELDEKQDVKEKYKLRAAKETIDFLFEHGAAKVALATHFGRPEGKRNEQFAVRQIADDAERILERNIAFADDCIGDTVKTALNSLPTGTPLLLENVRFHSGDETNDESFTKELSAPFDCFVNEAFSVCHRNQGSVTGITKFLPSVAGLHLIREVENLTRVREQPERPALAVIGGAKITTKLPLIKALEKKYDRVLVGGKIAIEAMEQHLKFTDTVTLSDDYNSPEQFDIGEHSIAKFREEILLAKTIVWNGPVGKFEQPKYARGTRAILDAIVESGAFSVVGGGESVEVLEEANAMKKISFVSTGGGAMLEFLAGGPMPGLEPLAK